MPESGGSAVSELTGSPAPEAGQDPQAASDVFVSYASKDAATANAVVAALESQGLKCWIAPRNVIPGSQYADGIVRAINGAKLLVLVLSESAIASPHVGKEVERASSKQRPIIALKTDTTPLTPALEYFLSESQWVDVGPDGMDAALAKLIAAVRRHLAAPDASASAPQSRTPWVRASSKRRLPWIAAVVACTVALALVYVAIKLRPHAAGETATATATPAAAPGTPAEKSVAVLPFVDMSEKKDQEYFSDGLSEELIDMLAKVPDLRVPARTSSFYFKETTRDHRGDGQSAGCRAHTRGQRAQVRQYRTRHGAADPRGQRLPSLVRDLRPRFERRLPGAGRHLADGRREIETDARQRRPGAQARATTPEVHNLYLQGRFFLQKETMDDLEKAIGFFQRAIAIDPSYAPAWSGLGFALFPPGGERQHLGIAGSIEKVNIAAQKAIELDPTLAEPYQVVCLVKMTGQPRLGGCAGSGSTSRCRWIRTMWAR